MVSHKAARVIFMGTPDFSVPILQALARCYTVVAVYSQPPSRAGRGKKQRPSPVHACADTLGIPVFTPKSLKAAEEQQAFAALKADVAVVAAYGLLLPKAILDAPRFGCQNVHASLLPRWRGAAPIQRAIMAQDTQSGVTIMQMDVGLDTGDMLITQTCPITPETTAADLHDTLSEMGAHMAVAGVQQALDQALQPIPQPNDGITYAAKISKAESTLSFDRPAAQVLAHVHGLSPFPGACVVLNGERIKILQATVQPTPHTYAPGTVVDDQLGLACADGILRPIMVQRAGKKPMLLQECLRGYAPPVGTVA